MKGGAKHTLEGLRSFEWAGLLFTLSNYLALPAVALLALVSAVELGGGRSVASLGGWLAGTLACVLFVLGFAFMIMGMWASHIGRHELGILQRKDVEKAERYFWRGVYAILPGVAFAIILGSQEAVTGQDGTPYREATVPYATLFAIAAAFASALLASRYFALFATQYLRNLTPSSGKKGRRRLRTSTIIAATLTITVAVAGLPLLLIDYNATCSYYIECPQEELWTATAPSFGPPAHLSNHLPTYLPIPLVAGSLVVAGALLLARLCALVAIRGWRKQVREAEVFVRNLVRAGTPPPMPPG